MGDWSPLCGTEWLRQPDWVPIRDFGDLDWPTSIPLEYLEEVNGGAGFFGWQRPGAYWGQPAASNEPIHWQRPASHPGTAACHGKHTTAAVTTSRWLVSCGACKESRAWKAAA